MELDEYLSQCPCVEHKVWLMKELKTDMTNTTCPYHMCTKQRKSTVSNLISLDLYFCKQIELIVSPDFEDNSPSYH